MRRCPPVASTTWRIAAASRNVRRDGPTRQELDPQSRRDKNSGDVTSGAEVCGTDIAQAIRQEMGFQVKGRGSRSAVGSRCRRALAPPRAAARLPRRASLLRTRRYEPFGRISSRCLSLISRAPHQKSRSFVGHALACPHQIASQRVPPQQSWKQHGTPSQARN